MRKPQYAAKHYATVESTRARDLADWNRAFEVVPAAVDRGDEATASAALEVLLAAVGVHS